MVAVGDKLLRKVAGLVVDGPYTNVPVPATDDPPLNTLYCAVAPFPEKLSVNAADAPLQMVGDPKIKACGVGNTTTLIGAE